MYKSRVVWVKPKDDLYSWCDENAKRAKLLRNAVLFRLRNIDFMVRKGFQNLNQHQIEIRDELNTYKPSNVPDLSLGSHYVSYKWLNKMFKESCNSDYRSGLPMHAVQRVIKQARDDFDNYHKALNAYYKDPDKFTGKPNMPNYVTSDIAMFSVSNQEAHVKNERFLKLPKTKLLLDIGEGISGKLLNVKIVPCYDCYKICVTFETISKAKQSLDVKRCLGIDPGVNNFLTVINNVGLAPFIVDGKAMKSRNVWFNKEVARLSSCLKVCQDREESRRLNVLWRKRSNYFRDKCHKIACHLVRYCMEHNIGTIVYGLNTSWKQNVKLGHKTNQDFCYLPHARFFEILKDHCLNVGIEVIRTEESYTSKASFLDHDFIPSISSKPDGWKPSGKRVKRGLYKSQKGMLINADVNGACNILLKYDKKAFSDIIDFSYLVRTVEKVHVA